MKELEKIEKEQATKNYDIEKLKKDMDNDLQILEDLLNEIKKVTIDTKLDKVIETILKEQILEKKEKWHWYLQSTPQPPNM